MRFSDLQQWWRATWATYFWQSVITKPGEGATTSDIVLMAGETGNETQQLTRLEQFGDVRCPPPSSGCISLQKGAGGVTLSLGDPGSRPTDAKPGDRGLYSDLAGTRVHLYGTRSAEPGAILIADATGARFKIQQDGSIHVDSASGKPIVLNGGTHDNAREGDGVWAGDVNVSAETDGMTDTLKVEFQTRDPEDPNWPRAQKLIEWKGPAGSAVYPTAGNSISVKLTGVIVRGRTTVKS